MNRVCLFLFVLVLPLPTAERLSAQVFSAPLDTVEVQVGARASQSLGSSTRAVEVIDRESISRSGVRSVVEALGWGFGVELSPYSAALNDVGIRGSTFEQVLVLVNGVRMRDSQTGHFNLNLAIPLEQVERIEILRGPAAALYGSDAMAGVINIITRVAPESETSVGFSTGSAGALSMAGARRQAIAGGATADIGASYDAGDGHRTGTDFDNRILRLDFGLPLGDHTMKAELSHARRAFGADGFYGAYPAFETTRTTSAIASGKVVAGERLVIEPALRWRRNTDDFILYRDQPARYRNRHSTVQLGGDLIARLSMRPGVIATAGLHGHQDEVESVALGQHRERVGAASLELAVNSAGRAGGSLGLRGERSPSGKLLIAPAASIGISFGPALRLRSSLGRAYRLPTWTERFYRDPIHQGRADLTWESAWSADAGFDLYPMHGLKLSSSVFVRRESDLIDWARPSTGTDPIWRTRNVDEATFRGLEAQVELPEVLGTRVRTRGSWISVTSSASEGWISKYALRPQVESLEMIVDRDIGDTLQLSARGRRERRSGEAHHFRLDGRVSANFGGAKLFVDFTNLTDTEYLDITQHLAPGRGIVAGIEWRS